ncbi:hypothetical protein MMC13_004280 [Lambiella insularis]|nr:hypothetical protein [Lambiella insularis]
MNGPKHHTSQDRSSDQMSIHKNGSKRKNEEPSSPHSRAKRNRYVTIACNECKRRKIRCNGETPCHSCGNMSLECLYEANCCSNAFQDTEDFRRMNDHIQSLQEQCNQLYASLNALVDRPDGAPSGPLRAESHHQTLPERSPSTAMMFQQPASSPGLRAKVTPFHGPTTSTFNFDVANSTLQTMGITQSMNSTSNEPSAQDQASAGQHSENTSPGLQPAERPAKDPLVSMKKKDVIRLCKVYDDEVGLLYPILDIEKTISKADVLFNFMDSAVRTGLLKDEIDRGDAFYDDDTNVLKMILAAAMALVGGGESEMGVRLYDSVRTASESRLWQPVNLKGLMLLVITAEYHFHLGDEQQAYRIIGLAARLCFEMGLHRRDSLFKNFSHKEEMRWAVRLFWSIYALDQRWSFGTGMPFAIQEADIDPLLPRPVRMLTVLGLVSRNARNDTDDPHSSAAFAMADLAGHQDDDELSDFTRAQGQSLAEISLMNGQQMSYELTSLFEAVGGFGGVMPADRTDFFARATSDTVLGSAEEFAKIMKHCF